MQEEATPEHFNSRTWRIDSNYLASRGMMLEWFDKHLKGQPEGWERRFEKDEK